MFSEKKENEIKESFFRLVCIMARLRRPGGCPWDAKQTPASLKRYILEEAYEACEAIDHSDWDELKGELGDFLLQVVFQAEIQDEADRWDITQVLDHINNKMIRRHPHVFSSDEAKDAQAVEANWDRIKLQERMDRGKPQPQSALDGIPKGIPALFESYKLGKKAAKTGFDWPEPAMVLEKVFEEIEEIRQTPQSQPHALQEELGDLLFAISQLVRKFGFEPEETLRAANRKFTSRFKAMEILAKKRGLDFIRLTLEEQESLWQAIKEGNTE